MTNRSGSQDMVRARIRSGARLLALLVAALFLLLVGLEVAEPDGFPAHTAMLLAVMGPSFVGALVAWWRERVGGLLLKAGAGTGGLIGWSSYSLFGIGEVDLLAATPVFAGLSLLAGLLFFLVSDTAG